MVAKLAKTTMYPLLLLSVWFAGRQLVDSRTGFFAQIAAASIVGIYQINTFIMPTNICLIFVNILFWTFIRQKDDIRFVIPSTLIITLIFYTHITYIFVVLITLFIYTLVQWYYSREFVYVRNLAINVVGALILYSPWFLHILVNLSVFHGEDVSFGLSIPVLLVLLAIPSIYTVLKEQYHNKFSPHFIFVAFLVGTLVMLPYGNRFWAYFSFAFSIFVGMTITRIKSLVQKLTELLTFLQPIAKLLPTLGLLLLIIPAFTFHPLISEGAATNPTGLPFISPSPMYYATQQALRARGLALTPGLAEACQWINANLPRTEIIHIVGQGTEGPFTCTVAMLTGNPVTGGQWTETVTPELDSQIKSYLLTASGYFLYKNQNAKPPGANELQQFESIFIAFRPPPP